MLLVGQVPLLFELEHVGVVIVHCASAIPFLSNLTSERGDVNAPGVEPYSSTLRNERAFENRTGRKGEHVDIVERQEEMATGLRLYSNRGVGA
jgi:hypothetical protein